MLLLDAQGRPREPDPWLLVYPHRVAQKRDLAAPSTAASRGALHTAGSGCRRPGPECRTVDSQPSLLKGPLAGVIAEVVDAVIGLKGEGTGVDWIVREEVDPASDLLAGQDVDLLEIVDAGHAHPCRVVGAGGCLIKQDTATGIAFDAACQQRAN